MDNAWHGAGFSLLSAYNDEEEDEETPPKVEVHDVGNALADVDIVASVLEDLVFYVENVQMKSSAQPVIGIANSAEPVTVSEVRTLSRHGDSDLSDSDSSSSSDDDDSSSSDSDSSLSASELSSSDSFDDEEMQEMKANGDPSKDQRQRPKTKNEITFDDLPEVQTLDIHLPDDVDLTKLGTVKHYVPDERVVVVEGCRGQLAVNSMTMLWNSERKAIGEVHEPIGTVIHPFYTVRCDSAEQMNKAGLSVGDDVYYAALSSEYTNVIFPAQLQQLLQMKGSDASWRHDEEPPPAMMDFSDDEEEQRVKRLRRQQNGEEVQPDQEPAASQAPDQKRRRRKPGGRDKSTEPFSKRPYDKASMSTHSQSQHVNQVTTGRHHHFPQVPPPLTCAQPLYVGPDGIALPPLHPPVPPMVATGPSIPTHPLHSVAGANFPPSDPFARLPLMPPPPFFRPPVLPAHPVCPTTSPSDIHNHGPFHHGGRPPMFPCTSPNFTQPPDLSTTRMPLPSTLSNQASNPTYTNSSEKTNAVIDTRYFG